MIKIRNEKEEDYRIVEKITKKSFWNMYVPGCCEHYLVHRMRSHEDFIPELDFIIEKDEKIIGNVMYTKAKLIDENKNEKKVLTLGPVCILPEFQRKGYGKILLNHSFEKAKDLGYDTVVLFGSPANYVSRGFKSCKRYNVSVHGGKFPAAMMIKELKENIFDGRKWTYYDSPVMNISEKEADIFDKNFEEKLEKKFKPSQEEFFILSNSFIE